MKLRRDVCYSCGAALVGGEQSYRLRIELFASPEVPDLSGPATPGAEADLRAQWEAMVQEMSAMSEEQVEEATDEVYERYEFVLCTSCRRQWHDRLAELARRPAAMDPAGPAPAPATGRASVPFTSNPHPRQKDSSE